MGDAQRHLGKRWLAELMEQFERQADKEARLGIVFPPPFDAEVFAAVSVGASSDAQHFAYSIIREHLAARERGEVMHWEGPPLNERAHKRGIDVVAAYYDAMDARPSA